MARRRTYGENMAAFERRQDEMNWRRSFITAMDSRDYESIEYLVLEGLDEGYEFPLITNQVVVEYIDKLQKRN